MINWLDVVLLVGFFSSLSLAYKRGAIQEGTDIIALFVGGIIGFRLYRVIAGALYGSVLKAWNEAFVQRFVFFVIFVSVFLMIFGAGLTLERKLNETRTIDKTVNSYAGLGLGFLKSAWLGSLLLAMFFYLNLVPSGMAASLKKGIVVQVFSGLSVFTKPTVYLMAPSDLADDFMNRGYRVLKK